MRKLLLLLMILPVEMALYAQTSAAAVKMAMPDSASGPRFYFPATLFNDVDAVNKALPHLAEQLIAVYPQPDHLAESGKADYYDTAFSNELVARNYTKAIALVDSFRKYNQWDSGNKAIGMEFESFARAKNKGGNEAAAFKQEYLKTFKDLYNHLPTAREKIFADYFLDTSNVTSSAQKFNKAVAKFKNSPSDSISLKDAQQLVYHYSSYMVYQAVIPLARPFLEGTDFHVLYPLIKNGAAGVVPVADVDEFTDTNMKYKLLMELTSGIKNKEDSVNINSVNGGLAEVGRKINLHLAAGVSKNNLDVVVVVHGPVLYSLLNNESYQKKYKKDNPNVSLIKDLQKAGVKFIACGQAMFGFNVKREEMVPGMKVALSAQTVLSTYQMKNYVYYDLGERK